MCSGNCAKHAVSSNMSGQLRHLVVVVVMIFFIFTCVFWVFDVTLHFNIFKKNVISVVIISNAVNAVLFSCFPCHKTAVLGLFYFYLFFTFEANLKAILWCNLSPVQ